jgi:hypothetical protein
MLCDEQTAIHDSGPSGRNVFQRKCNACKAIQKAFERRTKDQPGKRQELHRMSALARRDWHRKQKRHRELMGERGRYDFQELQEKHSFRTHFVPFNVYAQRLLQLHPDWNESKLEQEWFERLDSPHVRKRIINGEECVAMFEGLIVDEVSSHSSGATFSKSRTLQDVAQLSDSQTAAATWVSEMHAVAHQEGTCVQFHEKPIVQPSDIRNLESTTVCGPSAASADTMRMCARDLAKVQAMKQ